MRPHSGHGVSPPGVAWIGVELCWREQKRWPNNAAAPIPRRFASAMPLPLTDREREIALLVVQGLSNRDVAERLTLSVRTVEGHIYKAMTKTGTATREELAALLLQH